MQLLTADILKKFSTIKSQENNPDPIVIAKYFHPASSWTWYALEFDPSTRTFFGYVVGDDSEYGYFSLDELLSFRGRFWLTIERDMYCGYKPLSAHLYTL